MREFLDNGYSAEKLKKKEELLLQKCDKDGLKAQTHEIKKFVLFCKKAQEYARKVGDFDLSHIAKKSLWTWCVRESYVTGQLNFVMPQPVISRSFGTTIRIEPAAYVLDESETTITAASTFILPLDKPHQLSQEYPNIIFGAAESGKAYILERESLPNVYHVIHYASGFGKKEKQKERNIEELLDVLRLDEKRHVIRSSDIFARSTEESTLKDTPKTDRDVDIDNQSLEMLAGLPYYSEYVKGFNRD